MDNKNTLYTLAGEETTTPLLLAFELSKLPVTVRIVTRNELKEETLKKLNPLAKTPFLQTQQGTLYGDTAILRYLANLSESINASSLREKAEVDQWLEWIKTDLACNVDGRFISLFGQKGPNSQAFTKKGLEVEIKNLIKSMDLVNRHLKGKKYLTGDRVTIADMLLVSKLFPLYNYVLNAGQRKKMANLTKYYDNLMSLDGFKNVLRPRDIKAEFPLVYGTDVKEGKNAKKAAKKNEPAKKKKEAPKQTPPPKPKKPTFPESKFNLFNFKTFFVNEKDKQKKMQYVWDNFDEKAFAFWHLTYDKLEGECEKLYITNNLMNGFIMRAEVMRKYVFGVHCIYGEENNYNIKGVWLGAGTEELPLIKEHVQHDVYKYRKLDPKNPADRQLITDYWTSCEEDKDVVEGEVLRTFSYVK